MKRAFSKKTILISLAVSAVLLILFLFAWNSQPKRTRDLEFAYDSGIRFTEITDLQVQNLSTLGKVWGFAKYRHPSVTSGKLNWDAELFRVLPQVLEATSTAEANSAILAWLNQFPFTVPKASAKLIESKEASDRATLLEPDLTWIEDSEGLGDDLCAYLSRLAEVWVTDTKNSYASSSKTPTDPTMQMAAEASYPAMKPNDTGMRLLGLFRYWNIIEYFYPYRDMMEEDWDSVLEEMITPFISGQSEQSYLLQIAHLSTYIHDSHATLKSPEGGLLHYFGANVPPVEFMQLDGEIVISTVAEDTKNRPEFLQPGDVIVAMDGKSIQERLDDCRNFISLSHDNRFVLPFRYYLLATHREQATVEVLRDNKPLSLTVACHADRPLLLGQQPSGLLEEGQLGYINPAKLAKGELDRLMTQFQGTKGLIVDLRNYPSDFITFTLADYLIATSTPFASYGYSVSLLPGTFARTQPISSGGGRPGTAEGQPAYPHPVVLLMDETSISNAEYTIMSLRNAPNAVVLGSPSIGADGNVVTFSLPGAISTRMTGLSIFYPDGRPTQRVGLEPDVGCTPTLADVKAGKDTLLEKAISMILQK